MVFGMQNAPWRPCFDGSVVGIDGVTLGFVLPRRFFAWVCKGAEGDEKCSVPKP